MRAGFGDYHPAVTFVWFMTTAAVTMLYMHPAFLVLSLISALAWGLRMGSVKGATLRFLAPMAFFAMLINPLFSHEGVTILAWFPNGNPLTLESILYGIAAGIMLGAAVLLFINLSAVMTTDRLICLFGRIIPALSLLLSMTLRFVPRFTDRVRRASDAQRALFGKLTARRSVRVFSGVTTWALDSSLDTADSMRARGWGLRGRTAYSIFRMEDRDWLALSVTLGCGAYILWGILEGGAAYRYYPSFSCDLNAFTIRLLLVYALLCALPLIIDAKEDRKWKSSK
ncbi:MAG: energy-coupling factor transporter transmembrane protein EcfT [Clostridia bacterium]|nr:energy-coupling factor transporter transmembrane protein EcfT [Clostridia bacterium]